MNDVRHPAQMSTPSLHTWAPLVKDGSVRWLKYSFGPGTANTLAVRLDDGRWLVINPSIGSAPAVLDGDYRPHARSTRRESGWERTVSRSYGPET